MPHDDDVTPSAANPTSPEGSVPSITPDGEGRVRMEWPDPFAKGRAEAQGAEDHAEAWDSAFAAAGGSIPDDGASVGGTASPAATAGGPGEGEAGDEGEPASSEGSTGEGAGAAEGEAASSGEDEGPRKVAIIAGGLGHERDISIRSGRRAAQVLRDQGFEVQVWDLDQSLTEKLKDWNPDAVWPLVHGSSGEDGSLQEFISLLGFPCVGADGARARLASHKPTAKAIVMNAGLFTPAWATLSQSLFRQVGAVNVLDALMEGIGLPVVVKPADGGSALGLTVVHEQSELPSAMVSCFAYSQEALVEQVIEGQEVSAAVVALDGPDSARALQLVEVASDDGYDFDARYNPGRAEFFVPARLDDAVAAEVARVAEQVHSLFQLGELSRVDFIVSEDGTPWVIDLNVAPGMTETSLFPQAAAEAGPELYAAIVRAAAGGFDDEGEGDVVGEEEGEAAGTEGDGIVGFAGVGERLPACPECGAEETHHLVFGLGEEPGKPNTIYGGMPLPDDGPWPNLQCVKCGNRWRDDAVAAD
ncbi:MAG: ATP-grasp domain-containing protein [bacterium]|nr:ATP-grasp domain-containing protein [bacterium]